MADKREILLYPGSPKTGTSALQAVLRCNVAELKAAGWNYLHDPLEGDPTALGSGNGLPLVVGLMGLSDEFDPLEVFDRLAPALRAADPAGIGRGDGKRAAPGLLKRGREQDFMRGKRACRKPEGIVEGGRIVHFEREQLIGCDGLEQLRQIAQADWIEGARASVEGIRAMKGKTLSVKSLQEHHEMIKPIYV